jgi:hypothetical protein
LLGVLVRCKNKHVLPGLFIIYRMASEQPSRADPGGLAQLWSAHRTLLCERAPPPDGLPDARYALAFSDRRGYLEPVGAADDPWRRFYGLEKLSPHQPKIASRGYTPVIWCVIQAWSARRSCCGY